MTLNTFPYAGVVSKNVTRLKEIVDVAVNIKTPLLTMYLEPEYGRFQVAAKTAQQELVYTSSCTVTAAVEI